MLTPRFTVLPDNNSQFAVFELAENVIPHPAKPMPGNRQGIRIGGYLGLLAERPTRDRHDTVTTPRETAQDARKSGLGHAVRGVGG